MSTFTTEKSIKSNCKEHRGVYEAPALPVRSHWSLPTLTHAAAGPANPHQSSSCTHKDALAAQCHAKHACKDSRCHPAGFAIKTTYSLVLRSLCSKQYATDVIDYNHTQNKLQIKAMLILSPMLVSVEHQYTTNFKLYWKCKKNHKPSDKQNNAENWLAKEGLYKDIRCQHMENPSQKLGPKWYGVKI